MSEAVIQSGVVHDTTLPGGVEARLKRIITILGNTKRSFYPFIESTGTTVRNFGAASALASADEAGNVNLQAEFTPIVGLEASGLFRYNFSGDNNRHLHAADHADHSFEGATEAFSGVIWVIQRETGSAIQVLMSKYDEGVATEWDFHLSASDALTLRMYDGIDGATGDIIAVDTGPVITRDKFTMVGFTYDGGADAGVVRFYVNGGLSSAITVTETSAYVNMDDTAAEFLVGARNDGGAPEELFEGWLWAPQLTAKALSAADHRALYAEERVLVGV